ncbi:MAG: hypothetical protein RR957_01485 [Oscillospiraceae bacterium]
MSKLKALFFDSMAYNIYNQIITKLLPSIILVWYESFIWHAYKIIDKKIIQSKPVQIFLDPKYITDAWYASSFYRISTYYIRKLSTRIPKTSLSFRIFYIGIFLAIIMFASKVLTPLYATLLFAAVAILYISHHATERTGIIFMLVNYILLIFVFVLALGIPSAAFHSLYYMLLAIDFFFLVTFSVNKKIELEHILCSVYLILFSLCGLSLVQSGNIIANAATFNDPITFAEVILILFPFAMAYPLQLKSNLRRFIYFASIIFLSFSAILAVHSKAALIGFSIEVLLFILLTNWKYLPFLLFLSPAITRTAISNIVAMWEQTATHGNIFENIFYVIRNFWSNGFGVKSSVFLDIYNSSSSVGSAALSIPHFEISPVYFNILLDLGAIIMFGFLYYILRLAHSSFTSLFSTTKKERPVFAAGLAMLIGISISSLFESTLFSPPTLIAYWGMLGILRSAKTLYVYET